MRGHPAQGGQAQPAGRDYWVGVTREDSGSPDEFVSTRERMSCPAGRMKRGDGFVRFLADFSFRDAERRPAFMAAGIVMSGPSPLVAHGHGFSRRWDIEWIARGETPLRPLLGILSFTADRKHWGEAFSADLLPISVEDFQLIVDAMRGNAAPSLLGREASLARFGNAQETRQPMLL